MHGTARVSLYNVLQLEQASTTSNEGKVVHFFSVLDSRPLEAIREWAINEKKSIDEYRKERLYAYVRKSGLLFKIVIFLRRAQVEAYSQQLTVLVERHFPGRNHILRFEGETSIFFCYVES